MRTLYYWINPDTNYPIIFTTPLDDYPNAIQYVEGQEPQELLDAQLFWANKDRVQLIKAKANQLINEKYPTYKQLNIIRTGGEALNTMSAYIDGIRTQSNALELDVTKTAEDFIAN